MNNTQPVDRRMTVAEAALYLGLDQQTLAKWRCEHKGPPFMRLGTKAIRYSQHALDVWMAENTVTPGEPVAAK